MTKPTYKLPSDLVSDIKTRLKTLSGQLNGIVKMLDAGKDPEQINIQLKSVDKGLQKAHFLLLDEVYRKALAIGIVKAVDSCPGNCGNEDKINYLKKEFPNIALRDLTEKFKEIQAIEQRLNDYNQKSCKNIWRPPPLPLHLCAVINLKSLKMKKQVEIFTAGCPVCEPVVQLVKDTAGVNCNITIYNLSKDYHNAIYKKYAIKRLPAVAVDGSLLDCCKNSAITKEDLIGAGIGTC